MTTATASPTWRTRSSGITSCGGAKVSLPSLLPILMSGGLDGTVTCGMRPSPSAAASRPVSTATTPGTASAPAVSISSIRAFACGARTMTA